VRTITAPPQPSHLPCLQHALWCCLDGLTGWHVKWCARTPATQDVSQHSCCRSYSPACPKDAAYMFRLRIPRPELKRDATSLESVRCIAGDLQGVPVTILILSTSSSASWPWRSPAMQHTLSRFVRFLFDATIAQAAGKVGSAKGRMYVGTAGAQLPLNLVTMAIGELNPTLCRAPSVFCLIPHPSVSGP
jgi:hypothetical protein